jgi:N-acetylmuramoyl-L-alanine amidase
MANWSRLWAIACFAGLCFPAGAAERNGSSSLSAAQQQMPVVMSVQLQDQAGKSRLILEFSDPIDFHIFLLAAPDRAVIDMPQVLWRAPQLPAPSGKAMVKDYRFGMFRKDVARLVLDLNRPIKIDNAQVLSPKDGAGFRLILDLAPTTVADFAAHTGWPRSFALSARNEEDDTPSTAQNEVPLIILDPGHGGMDPGTHGASGLLEKDLALAVAKQLKDQLEQSGRYHVKLTRDRDVFIPLRDRVNIARAAHGDLFVSLHADSNEHREIRGASVYTLSPGASDRETENLAEKENHSGADFGQGTPEPNPIADAILLDLGQREIMNLSARFAETIVATLPAATTIHSPSPHRSADFAVLKAPDIPSVLVELGYLTNPEDERQMTSAAWRRRVASAVAAAIDRHFSRIPALQRASAEVKPLPSSGHIPGVRTPITLRSRTQE